MGAGEDAGDGQVPHPAPAAEGLPEQEALVGRPPSHGPARQARRHLPQTQHGRRLRAGDQNGSPFLPSPRPPLSYLNEWWLSELPDYPPKVLKNLSNIVARVGDLIAQLECCIGGSPPPNLKWSPSLRHP